VIVAVKALACELPAVHGLPLSRFSISELKREAQNRGLVASIGGTTLWRWLSQDAIRPWRYRSWIFPRDPNFEEKAATVLDLYQGVWKGRTLASGDYVLSSDEKTNESPSPSSGTSPDATSTTSLHDSTLYQLSLQHESIRHRNYGPEH